MAQHSTMAVSDRVTVARGDSRRAPHALTAAQDDATEAPYRVAGPDTSFVCERVTVTGSERAWRELAAINPSVFATFEWAQTWWETSREGRESWVLAVRRPDGAVAGIVPLYRERVGPLRVLRFMGDGASDELGPICAPEDRDAVARALDQYLRAHGRTWDLLIGRTMRADHGWRTRLGARLLNMEASGELDVGGRSWDEFLASRTSRFRQRRRAAERKAAKHGAVFRLVDDPQDLPAAIEALFDLHRRLRNGRPSSFIRRAAFHRAFISTAMDAGWLRLSLLEVEGRPLGATLEYTVGGVIHGYQMGFDRSHAFIDARLIIAMTLRRAFEDPTLREFRIGRGGEEYKRSFAEHDPGLETVVRGSGPLGSCVAWAMHRGRRLRPAARWVQGRLRHMTPVRVRPPRAEEVGA